MEEPRWLSRRVVDELHNREVQRHGGLPGIRDEGAIESALARPRQKWTYDPEADLAELAAGYGFGLARNHGYLDGNKRVGFVALAVFLPLNGRRLVAPEVEAVAVMLGVAAGELDEAALAVWIRRSITTVGEKSGA